MPQPCEQTETIQAMMGILGALKELPDSLKELRVDLKTMMREVQMAAADSREYRTLIQQNRKDIEDLHKVDHEQWGALEEMGKRLEASCRRAGERIEALERWQAGLNGGKDNGLVDRLESLIRDQERRKGRTVFFQALPIVISFGALVVAIVKAVH